MQALDHVLAGCNGHPILPFLWIHDEDAAVLRKKIEQIHSSSVPKACLSERIASFPLPSGALSLYRFGCLQTNPPKTMKKSGPFSHGRKVRILYLGAPDRRIFLQPVLYETRQHVFRPLHLYRPSRQTLPELGEFQKQKRKSTESYDSALFI